MKGKEEISLVERVASAIYESSVKQAKEQIDGLAFDSEALVQLVVNLAKESLTARVVVFGSYVEQTTIDLFKLHLRPMQNKQEHDRIFGPSGNWGQSEIIWRPALISLAWWHCGVISL